MWVWACRCRSGDCGGARGRQGRVSPFDTAPVLDAFRLPMHTDQAKLPAAKPLKVSSPKAFLCRSALGYYWEPFVCQTTHLSKAQNASSSPTTNSKRGCSPDVPTKRTENPSANWACPIAVPSLGMPPPPSPPSLFVPCTSATYTDPRGHTPGLCSPLRSPAARCAARPCRTQAPRSAAPHQAQSACIRSVCACAWSD